MTLNLTVNESSGGSPSVTPGTFSVRVKFVGVLDSGHVSGPFATREAAENAATVALGRDDVESATIETEV